MTYAQILETLEAETRFRCTTFDQANITNFIANDMMSDVLTVEDENFVLITSLNSEQVLRTADIVGARGVLLVNGKLPLPSMISLAEELNISIVCTPLRMFKTCYLLAENLKAEGIQI